MWEQVDDDTERDVAHHFQVVVELAPEEPVQLWQQICAVGGVSAWKKRPRVKHYRHGQGISA